MFGKSKKKQAEAERLDEEKKIEEYTQKLVEEELGDGSELDYEKSDIIKDVAKGLSDGNSSKGKKKKEKEKVDSSSEEQLPEVDLSDDSDVKIGLMRPENYGDMLQYIEDTNVTDINWNGSQLWIDDLTRGRYVSEVVLTDEFVNSFSTRVSNVVSKAFNKYSPVLEAETEELRISILHSSISRTGTSISIRKTPAIKRINFAESIKNGDYCSEEIANFMSNSVKAKLNVLVCGLPGVGKTELVKYLTGYIFPHDRAITIEDSLELHYKDINPDKDCLMLKVNDTDFTYVDAIKASLRQFPQWIILSEARSVEVKYLIESLSTGAKCLTTIHTDDVRKLPDRIKNMIGDNIAADRVENEVYSFIDVAILINKKSILSTDGKSEKIKRYIDQVAVFTRDEGKNECRLIFDEGKRTGKEVQESTLHKYELAGISDPFKYTFI